jgi:ABC-type bacteriocin/lantibiotic exporter with double-glycine peptidase domain
VANGAAMKRRLLVPEVIQTSAMDCGPAALKALFGGFGLYLSYGRLREACHTEVDGTSLDTLETVARQLGLDASQVMMPTDVVLLNESACIPAMVLVSLPGGGTHIVVLWRVQGPWVQIMDPAAGRIWMRRQQLLDSLYIHRQSVAREDWLSWVEGPAFMATLHRRMRALGVAPTLWSDRAHQDAALRLAGILQRAGKLRRGRETRELLSLCANNPEHIPDRFWAFRPLKGNEVEVRGTVLITAAGPLAETEREPLPASLSAVKTEPPPRVWSSVLHHLDAGGKIQASVLMLAIVAAALGTAVEALLFRGLLEMAQHLNRTGERLLMIAAVMLFSGCLLALEWPAAFSLLRMGRHLELKLRIRFQAKIPRLHDRYFQSRLISDMAFRIHSLHLLRQLPEIAGQFARLAASVLFTVVAIAWLYPGCGSTALLAVIAAVGVPVVFQPAMVERELRFREMQGSLSRFYLDALLGVRAVQAHCGQQTLAALQADQLKQWAGAGLRQQTLVVLAEAVQMLLTFVPAIRLVYLQAVRQQNPAALLLLSYWALVIPITGRQLASLAWAMPTLRNTLLRFMEPLGAPEEAISVSPPAPVSSKGVELIFDDVAVVAAGQPILQNINVRVEPGEHIGIVGLSGAGKSSLSGLLLGWHTPSEGTVRVDGVALDSQRMAELRRETAWIDPQVHLFNTTLFENVTYGCGATRHPQWEKTLDDAELIQVVQHLPNGMQTVLGEGGALVSGGEGQSVRIARALGQQNVRLAILDEPARGFERPRRKRFLATARRHFATATLLYITHDVADTLEFDRVLVMENGRILEQGRPHDLYQCRTSRYRALCDREEAVHRLLWSHPSWRRLEMDRGVVKQSMEASLWTHA